MSDHQKPANGDAAGDDSVPIDRFVNESRTRHRRRRAPGDPHTTGSIPIVRTSADSTDPMIEYRHPERAANEFLEIRYASAEPDPVPPPERTEAFVAPPPPPPPPVPPAPRPRPVAPEPVVPESVAPKPEAGPDPTAATEELATPAQFAAPEPPGPAPRQAVPAPRPPVPAPEPFSRAPEPFTPAPDQFTPVPEQVPAPQPVAAPEPSGAGLADILDLDEPVAAAEPVRGSRSRTAPAADDEAAPGSMPARKRGRKPLIALVAIVAILAIAAVGVLWKAGVFASSKNFDSVTGDGSNALVEVPAQASVREIGQRLTDAGVVGSQKAFIDAVDGRSLSSGYYLLPKGVSAEAAVNMMADPSFKDRVGRFVIPEGLQLESKKGIDGKTTPGIFEMIAEATTFELDGQQYGVTVDELYQAAAHDTVEQLGIPDWAQPAAKKLDGDHRRIEGLIASGAWEDVDPRLGPRELLNVLITKSATRFDAWGLQSGNHSGLMPYDTLIVASIVEREVSQEDDYAKVARVILNRLDKEQRLEMDSTANYTAEVTDIDVKGEAYTSKTEWNTYQKDGLPVTPIGAVGQRALQSVENPAQGNWLYFVTIDNQGTTLFANTYTKHRQNRQIACRNKVLTTGC